MEKKTLFFLFLIFSLSIFLHFLNLSYPDKVVFDEQWYASSAASYFQQSYYFDTHPPLGKLLNHAGTAKSAAKKVSYTGSLEVRRGAASAIVIYTTRIAIPKSPLLLRLNVAQNCLNL